MVFARTETIEHLSRGQLKRPSEIVLLVRTRGHDLCLRALRHPGCTDFGQGMSIEFIRKHHALMCLYIFLKELNVSQALDASRIIIFGHALRPVPHPAN